MRKIAAFAFAVVAALSASAVKVEWYQDVDNVSQTKVVVCYHGEDLRLFIKPRKNGSDHAITGSTAEGWWQTKEMGDAWTRTNAVINTYTELGDTKYRFEITWPKGREGNADEVRFFVKWSNGGEAPGETPNPGVGEISYRINFIIKFLGSPGANPTEVPIPRRVLDFAKTEVRNSPYLTAEDVTQFATWEAIQSWWDEAKADVENVTNMLTEAVAEVAATTTALRVEMKNYVDAEIQTSGLTTPTTVTNIVDAKIAAIPQGLTMEEVLQNEDLFNMIDENDQMYSIMTIEYVDEEIANVSNYVQSAVENQTNVFTKAETVTKIDEKCLVVANTIASTSDAAYYPKSQGNQLAASVGTIAAEVSNTYTKAEADGRYLKTNGSGTMSGALVISDDIIGDVIKYGSSSLVEVNINGRPKSNWFNGGCDYADEANALTMKLYGSMPNGKVYADALGNFVFEHRDGEESNLTPDGSPVATSNMVERIATNFVCHTNPRFSNEVLAVGLNIDTNAVAVLNDIAATFGGFPVEGTATTVGGLLAALAAAVAWLKRKTASIEATVGTANGDLADALGGNS